jgi:fructan beta-fructosidase
MSVDLKWVPLLFVLMVLTSCKDEKTKKDIKPETVHLDYYTESYRPQFHFSPEEKWMNDPNGLVYHQGIYHLFYQYYPEDIEWGPMHWGHATSKDLIRWEHKPVALFPDDNGYIFSGSAVVDTKNTSGFGTVENPPLVAIFTYHHPDKETHFQTQGIAYSLDNGDTWAKYEGNPVIVGDPKDFRDPKVFWNNKEGLWSMLLVAGDHLQIWNSQNLIDWEKVSVFGNDQGAHGGVWECPDMFQLRVEGSDEEKWVLFISINPGAPNGGSGTQYFIGDFDGKTFTSDQTEERWVDWGTDNYAGVTYNNVPSGERLFIGWMSNWAYAEDTPTEKWRSAMTVPRKLSLRKIGNTYDLIGYPIKDLDNIISKGSSKTVTIESNSVKTISYDGLQQSQIRFTTDSRDFSMDIENDLGEEVVLSWDNHQKLFLLDRSKSGKKEFKESFAHSLQKMPIPNLLDGNMEVRILIDWSSVEIFINEGQYVMTAQVFPNEAYSKVEIKNGTETQLELNDFEIGSVERIW